METETTKGGDVATATRAAIAKQEERDLRDWFTSLGTAGGIRVKVHREAPKSWRANGRTYNVGGLLGEFKEQFDDNDLGEKWGGGKFRLQAFRLNEKGNWVYYTQRTVEIAGDPKVTGELFDETPDGTPTPAPAPVPVSDDPSLVRKALDMTERLANEERDERRRIEAESRTSRQPDLAFFESIIAPLRLMITQLQEELREARRQTTDVLTKKPDTSPTDRILEKMIDGDSARIQAIRTQHDSELRQLRESQEAAQKRLQDHYMEEARAKDRANERAIDSLRESHKIQIDSLKESHAARVDGLQSQIKRLESELDAARKEIAELRTKKEVPMEEQLTRLAALKEALEAFSGGGEESGGMIERIAAAAGPILEGVGARLAGGGAPQQQGIPQMLPPGAPEAAAQPQAPQTPPRKPRVLPFAIEDVKRAVAFCESAARSETDPMTFAASARSMVPGNILDYIRTKGVDSFLKLVPLEDGSILMTASGRQWIRAVGRALTGEAPIPTT